MTSPNGIPAGTGIVAVTEDGPADRAGLHPGDVIKAIGQSWTPDGTALVQALVVKDPGQNVTVTFDCGDQALTAQVTPCELPSG